LGSDLRETAKHCGVACGMAFDGPGFAGSDPNPARRPRLRLHRQSTQRRRSRLSARPPSRGALMSANTRKGQVWKMKLAKIRQPEPGLDLAATIWNAFVNIIANSDLSELSPEQRLAQLVF